MGRPCGPSLETTHHLQDIVLCVRGQRVSSGIDTDTGPARDIVVKLHVCGFRLVELHVPVAVRWNFFAELLSKAYLGKSSAIRWKRPGGECSRTWIIGKGKYQYSCLNFAS